MDKLGVSDANQTSMCLDPYLNLRVRLAPWRSISELKGKVGAVKPV